MKNKLQRYCIPLATSCLLTGVAVSTPIAVAAESAGLNSKDVAELLKRLQTMEAQLASSRQDISQLKSALADKTRDSGNDTDVTQADSAATEGNDEWGEPDIAGAQTGRDDEARRRLTEIETDIRKMKSVAVREEEERKGKVGFEFSGKYKVQFNSRNNFDLGNAQQSWDFDNRNFFDQRFQLQVDASYEDFLVRLLLDKGNFTFDWKEDSEGTLERWGDFESVNTTLVRELYGQYTNEHFMARIGRQNWDEGYGVVVQGPINSFRLQVPVFSAASITAGYLSLAGGWTDYTDFSTTGPPAGTRENVLFSDTRLDAYYLDFDLRPSRNSWIRPFLMKAVDGGEAGDADLNLDKDFNAATTPRDGGFNPLWSGIAGSVDIDRWRMEGEAVWLTGGYTEDRDIDANALLFRAERSFSRSKSLGEWSLGFELGRGSGNGVNDSATGDYKYFTGLSLCRDRHKFGEIFSEDIRAGYFLWDSNLANITYLRLDTTLKPAKGLSITPSIARIWTTEDVFEGRGPIRDWSNGTSTSTNLTNDVGWELDIAARYQHRKWLEMFANIGYFQPGAVYARPDGTIPGAAYEVVVGLELIY
ncbi:hypothetical protein [Sedimenticola selenatireducens]|uniref:hypothetical protein n=1 Tax=Sedimenticola selenatireducens TaxID=191960 RepID=UPI00048E5517|nr:hypothetical protein [Sedimenticola selenatireducens]